MFGSARSDKPSFTLEDGKRNIVVVGGGIIGLTTAYYLSADRRNQVSLVERNAAVMNETSG